MYFTLQTDIEHSLKLVEVDLLPSLKFQTEKLLNSIELAPETQGDDLQFYIIISEFNQEVQKLSRMLIMILFPAIRKSLRPSENAPALNGFYVIRNIHKRQQNITAKLRELCNQYTVESSWNEVKKLHCYNSYQLEAAFLNYLNFMESQVLFKLENVKTKIENEQD